MDHALPATTTQASTVVELRQYRMKPGGRDALIAMFEKHFVAPQEALGMRVEGPFRAPGHPDRFVWLRGFRSLAERPGALGAFYGGPEWKAHREAANATMEDSDDVLLLQPADEGRDFTLARRMGALMVATIYLLQAPVDADFLRFFRERVAPIMSATGAPPVATLKSLEVPNNFPKLPIREGVHAFVMLASFDHEEALRRHTEQLEALPAWKPVEAALAARLAKPVEYLVLVPTQRALDRNRAPYRYALDVRGGPHDFDFLEGAWTVASRRLVQRGVDGDAWESFPAESWAKPLLGGLANVDEIRFPTKGWAGATVRHFDVAKRQWSIHWINSRDGVMQPPVHGGFEGDTGLFYGEDVDEGRPVRAVYRWMRQGAGHARWEQAFSYDDGRTWETNWVMEFARRAPGAPG